MIETDQTKVVIDWNLAEGGEADGVQTVSLRGVVACRLELPELADGWIHAEVLRVARAGSRRTTLGGYISGLERIADDVTGAVSEAKDALAQRTRGHETGDQTRFAAPASLVVEKEVRLPRVGEKMSTEAGAKTVVYNARPGAANAIGIPTIRVQSGAAIILIGGSVVRVSTALG